MTIDELKRALVEVKRICTQEHCHSCPFQTNAYKCKLRLLPIEWDIDDWMEDDHDQGFEDGKDD